MAFDTITLPNGKTYRFAGNIDAVTTANGEVIQVTNQTATVRNQPSRGLGGILGALIGAATGVPADSAAAEGAILAQRGDMINIGAGSQITITALVPRS